MCREVSNMFRREIPLPVFVVIVVVALAVVGVFFWRKLFGGPTMVTVEQLPPELKQRLSPFPPQKPTSTKP